MGIWTDLAAWRGPTPNQSGRMVAYRGVVLHIAEGYYEGTVSWCLNPGSEISAHFVVAKDGSISQVVDTSFQAWCQSAGNAEWLSIENEGFSGEPLTPPQVTACAKILARAHREHGVPLEIASSPSGRGLGHHSMGGNAWGGHSMCPGSKIIAQKSEIIRQAGGVSVGGGGMSDLASKVILALSVGNPQTDDGHLVAPVVWQQRLEKWQADVNVKLQTLDSQVDKIAEGLLKVATQMEKVAEAETLEIDYKELVGEFIKQMFDKS